MPHPRIFYSMLVLLLGLSYQSAWGIEEGRFINVGKDGLYLHLPTTISAEEALSLLDEFQPSEREVYTLGVSKEALWVYLDLSQRERGCYYLSQLEPRMTSYKVFEVEGGTPHEVLHTGMSLPFRSRHMNISPMVYKLPTNSEGIYLLRFESKNNRTIPIYLADNVGLTDYVDKQSFINGLYFGLLIIMILYNSFIYISVRDINYLIYIIFLMSMILLMGYMTGVLQQYIFADCIYLKTYGSAIYPQLSGIIVALFIMRLLKTRTDAPVIHRLLIMTAGFYALSFLLGHFTESKIGYIFTHGANVFGSIVVFIAAIRTFFRGSITGRYVLMGWLFLAVGVILYTLTENGLMDYHYMVSLHYVQMGSAFEVLFFSFALSDRINRYKEERVKAEMERQQLLLEASRRERETTQRLADMESKALRAQMNPHFVFNALEAIRYYIQHNEPQQAETYLTKFARLIRMYLDTSKERYLTLRKEIELLTLYTELEHMRFEDKFKVEWNIAEDLDLDETHIPSMIIQPLVENAINHGLLDRMDDQGLLYVGFRDIDGDLVVVVADNGVGLGATEGKRNDEHTSLGRTLIRDRIHTLQQTGLGEVTKDYAEWEPENQEYPGTKVTLVFKGFRDE
ncbi:MAG: histidine kinase [Flavobacteriales bacterium]|nr:histidine kinase [Flavobacteriales bacterium]